MANRYIQTHTPDGNELDNKILPEGTIAVRGNQLIVGDGVTEASELEPSGDPAWAGGGVSFVIASGTVDLGAAGTTELTYASGVNGRNHIPQAVLIEAANGTDTFTLDVGYGHESISIESQDLIAAYNIGDFDAPVYNAENLILFVGAASLQVNSFSVASSASKYEFVVGATPPSSTQFRVNVKVLGIKTT